MGKTLRPMRVLVTGGRETTFKKQGVDCGAVYCLVVKTLNQISDCGRRKLVVIHGGARGVDGWADEWCFRTRTDKEVYPITKEEWDALGMSAGPKRNLQMLREGKPDLVLAFPGGNGTLDMLAQAAARGVKCFQVTLR